MKYLASPYSSPDAAVRHARYVMALRATAGLMAQGIHVFSPIVHNHEVAKAIKLNCGTGEFDWNFWRAYDLWFLDQCDGLFVLTLPGWEESVGVTAELQRANERGIPHKLLEPEAPLNRFGRRRSIVAAGKCFCPQCKKWRVESAFVHPPTQYSTETRHISYCIDCHNAYQRAYRKEHSNAK